jgi:signal transduction histidine kinase
MTENTAMTQRPVDQALSAELSPDGGFAGGAPEAFAMIGLDPATDRVRVPTHPRHVWGWSFDATTLYRIIPTAGGWRLECWPTPRRAGWDRRLATVRQENLSSVVRSQDLQQAVKGLASDFARATELFGVTIVLIEPSGTPTFAGGLFIRHRELAAMERCRLGGAPMAIWQAFEENRLVAAPHWATEARNDDRFAPIREFFVGDFDAVYVTMPLRSDRGVIGVVAGMWPDISSVSPERVAWWEAVADSLSLALQYSEVVRRARLQGAEATRIVLNDDLHATIAQDVFALSLEVARTAASALVDAAVLEPIRVMTEQLVDDVHAFFADSRPSLAGVGLARHLADLAESTAARVGARLEWSDEVDWEAYSTDFAEDIARIAAEALRNIAKHSAPQTIRVRTSVEPRLQNVVLEISDDGGAVVGPAAESTGVGRQLIAELVERRGGHLSIEPIATGGTRVAVRMPPSFESEWAVAQRALASVDPTTR